MFMANGGAPGLIMCYSYEFGKYHHDADLCEVITMTKWECKDNVDE